MLILKEQLVPEEFASVFSAEHAVLAEGIGVAWIAHASEIMTQASEDAFARRVAERLAGAPQARHLVEQMRAGAIVESADFRTYIMRRLFSDRPSERRAFAEGLALGNRVYDLFARHAAQRGTDATRVYLLVWLYWPEIARLGSIGEAARLLAAELAANRTAAGANWQERFRKIANRIGLSYRAKQGRSKSLPRHGERRRVKG